MHMSTSSLVRPFFSAFATYSGYTFAKGIAKTRDISTPFSPGLGGFIELRFYLLLEATRPVRSLLVVALGNSLQNR